MICPACSLENSAETEECFGCGKALFALTQGSVLADRYEIRRPLGQGGMGKVYEAWDRVLEDRMAVKVLRPQFAREPEMARRFLLEIRLARRITHANVCRLHEYGESEGIRYLCMELVDGVNLKDVLRARRLRSEEAYDVALAAAEGLAAVHAQGVIHRDFKTANIMLDARGQVKVMDFGIAKEAGADTTGLSLAGHVLGTPEYMSPEQAQGGTVDFRSDLYALGCVVFEIFAGRALFQGTSPIDTLRRHLTQPAEFSGGRGLLIPEALVPVLTRALAKRPEQRQRSVSELLDEMRAARDGAPLLAVLDRDDDVFVAPPPSVRPVSPDPSAPLTPGATRALSGPQGRKTAPGAKARGSRAVLGLALVVLVALVVVVWQRAAPPALEPETVATASVLPPTVNTTLPSPPSTTLAAAPEPTRLPSPRGDRERPPQRAEVRPTPPPATLVAAVAEPARPLASTPAPPPTTQPVAPPPTVAQAMGMLRLTVLPQSEVFIDDTPHGVVSSDDFRLPAGRHDLEVRNAGYKAYKRVVEVSDGMTTSFTVDLAVMGVALSEKGVRKNP